jgi:hypothetical protein
LGETEAPLEVVLARGLGVFHLSGRLSYSMDISKRYFR